jgi:hypothetical protein
MMAVDLIAATLPSVVAPEAPQIGVCCVTGATGPTIARHHAIRDSFTGLSLLRAPCSDRVGMAAWRVLTHRIPHPDPAKKRDLAPLRQSHWLCDGQTIEYLDLQGVRCAVVEGVSCAQWAAYATTSHKKHGALLTPVNTGARAVWLWETRLVDCSDRSAVADAWARLRAAQAAGIDRSLMARLDLAPAYHTTIDWRVWRDFDTWARPRLRAPLYCFLTFLLPTAAEVQS